jgi:hypothetical protein
MTPDETIKQNEPDEFLERLIQLEKRVLQLETELNITPSDTFFQKRKKEVATSRDSGLSESILETKVGMYGLVWVGNVVLLFGIIFLTQLLSKSLNPIVSTIVGFILTIIIFGLSYFIKNTYPHITQIFRITGILLIYYFTANLYFFTADPLLNSKWICLILLLLFNGFQFYLSLGYKSKTVGVIALICTIITAILSDTTHFIFIVATLISILSMIFYYKYQTKSLLVFSQILVYSLILMWMINNPFMGKDVQIVNAEEYSIIYVFIIASVYSVLTFFPNTDKYSKDFILWAILLNGVSFSFILLLYVLSFYTTNYILIFLILFVLCISCAVMQKIKSSWKFSSPLYAIYSFISLSIAVYGYYAIPGSFFILAIESLLVVSIALWFRSRFIVIMNLFMFVFLLISYLSLDETQNGINYAFAITPLVSARILNWKRERLEIKTSALRNTYLICAFFMVLYALYESVPKEYITLTWTGAAVFYYLMSLMLNKNIKYRWMAIFTFIITAFYLFIIDLERISLIFRVIAFMVLAIISIILSIVYAKKHKKESIAEGKEASTPDPLETVE